MSAVAKTSAFLFRKLQGGKVARLAFHSLYFVLLSLAKGSILIWNPVVSFFLSEITAVTLGRSSWLIGRKKKKKPRASLSDDDAEALQATRRSFGLDTTRRGANRLRELARRKPNNDIDDSEVLTRIRGAGPQPDASGRLWAKL